MDAETQQTPNDLATAAVPPSAQPLANGVPVVGPVGGPLPPADMPMKPHLPPAEVSAVRDEEPAPATVHHLPSDDRATAAAASAASSGPAPSAQPIAPATAADAPAVHTQAPVQPPAHDTDARGLNGTGIAGTAEDQPRSAIAPPQSQSQATIPATDLTSTVSQSTAPSSLPESTPGTQNPYNESEEKSMAISQPKSEDSKPAALPLESQEANTQAFRLKDEPSASTPVQPAITAPKEEDVEMKDVPTPTASNIPGIASTRIEHRRESTATSADGSQIQLAGPEATEMTSNQIKACQNAIKGLKGRTDSGPFHFPVDPIALNIPHYTDIVTRPMDLGTIDIKLALTAAAQKGGNKHTEKTKQAPKWNLDPVRDVYTSLDDFEKDVRLVFSNCIAFNGPDHPLSQTAATLDGVFEKQIKSIAASVSDENGSDAGAAALAASRRQSEGVAAARPKRDIHPPPPKDLPYADRPQSAIGTGGKRKKSRGALSAREAAYYDKYDKEQLKHCLKIIDDLHKPPLNESAWVFFEKPGMELDFAPAYYATIKNPVSMKEIRQRLLSGEYDDIDGPKEDMNLMFNNCFTFNEKGSDVYNMGEQVKKVWESKLAKLPRPAPPIVDEDDEDDDDEDEEEDDDDNEAKIQEIREQISSLQAQLDRLTGKAKAAKKTKKRRPSEGAATAKKAPAAKKAKSSASTAETKKGGKAKKAESGGGSSKKKEEDVREVTYEQKEELAAKITQLPDDRLDGALKIIAEDKPPNANEDEEIELDIDDLSPGTLYKLYRYVVRPKGKKVTTSKLSSSDGRKRGTGGVKRKNLDESEEAARIARLQAQLDQFDNPQAAPSGPKSAAAAAGHDDLVASDSSSGEEDYESESDYE